MKKILYDTNIFAYLLDNKVVIPKVRKLTRMIYDLDDVVLMIHPKTLEEARNRKDEEEKNIFLSKLSIYREIENPPRATQSFIEQFHITSDNDAIDCELLYSVKQNCVDFLITNDFKLKKKANRMGLGLKVLDIDEALIKFEIEEHSQEIDTPIFINEENLTSIELEDPFLKSLRDDYQGFDTWFEGKQRDGKKAFVVRNNGNVSALLMLKEEDDTEKNKNFEKELPRGKRLKVCTFKVEQKGKKIGESFIKLIFETAFNKEVEYVYVTVFEKHEGLINLLKEYGFEYYTKKKTPNSKGEVCLESVYINYLSKKDRYPYINYINQKVHLVPIQPEFNKLLFPEYEKNVQISIEDYSADKTVANAIRKAYICKSPTRKINHNDILVFYGTGKCKKITAIGVVDVVYHEFENFEEFYSIVRKRTAYEKNILQRMYDDKLFAILFKHYYTFSSEVERDYLLNIGIEGNVQCIREIKKEQFKNIVEEDEFIKNKIIM